jgi:hypothetical protein
MRGGDVQELRMTVADVSPPLAPTFAVRPDAGSVIDMPGWRPILRHAAGRMFLVTLLPMAVFYATLSLFGLRTAAVVTASLYYAALLSRVMRKKPVLAAALLAAGLLSLRTVVVFCTGSAFLYFIQPVIGTVAVATLFAATAIAGRPVLDRLAHDFCTFPAELSLQLRQARFFTHLSVVWATTYTVNAVGTVWLLTNASLDGFILVKSVLGPVITIAAAAASYLVFASTVRRHDICIRWEHSQPWGAQVRGRVAPIVPDSTS